MSRIGSSLQSVLMREILNNRNEMNDLQVQLASGKVADSYGGLGNGRTMSLALRQEMTQIEGFRNTITQAETRIDVMSLAVGQLRNHATDTRSQLMVAGFQPSESGQTLTQQQATARLADTVDLLNTDVAGRSLFAGAKTDEAPVESPSVFMDGTGTKAGFRQIMDERRQADLGSSGNGRLDLAASGTTGVSLAEDVANSPFGFKLGDVTSSLTGVTTTGPVGSPAGLTVDFSASLPENGEKISIALTLPDGTQKDLVLTASATGSSEAGGFSIGADAASTATNFQNALASLLSTEAETTLVAASMQAAADDFFTNGADAAQRVDGPPFDSATGLRDATESDTVQWYTGDRTSTPARETAFARVDENSLVAYGAKADEEGFSSLVKQLAIMSAAVFEEDGYDQYAAMTERVANNLGDAGSSGSLDRIVGELAIAQTSLNDADERHLASDNMVTNFLAEIETADINEVGAKLLSMQTQLQASYQVTSMMSKLSLANYL